MDLEFQQLYKAVTGREADARVDAALAEMVRLSGLEPEAFPRYLSVMAHSLANHKALAQTPLAESERGYTWVLQALLPILPGCELGYDVDRDLFICEPLGLAAAINRKQNTFAVIAWPEAVDASNKPRVLGTFDPSEEQIRAWAYDPNLRFTAQDEFAAVEHRNAMPLLIELADDPMCPKRRYIIDIADCFIASARRDFYDRELHSKAAGLAGESGQEDLRAWGRGLHFISQYIGAQGPVGVDMAESLSRLIFTGRCRSGFEVRRDVAGPWWWFTSYDPDTQQLIDYLYICQDSGALLWSREPMTEVELVPYKNPRFRDQYLGERSRAQGRIS